METFWFFWLWFRRAYDSAYDSDFWFSLGHKRSYDSDSVASENQPLENDPSHPEKSQMSGSIVGITKRNTFWVVPLPFCLFSTEKAHLVLGCATGRPIKSIREPNPLFPTDLVCQEKWYHSPDQFICWNNVNKTVFYFEELLK